MRLLTAATTLLPSTSGLLITLAILKALIQECRRDITYISGSALSILSHGLSGSTRLGVRGKRDLELSARVSSTFFAYTNALDPARNSVDTDLGRVYLSLLQGFADMATETGQDSEETNRIRLVGLGAISGAVSSDVFYTSSFRQQSNIIAPALFHNIQANSAPLDNLETEAQKTTDGTPSFAEFVSLAKKRPGHRRAPSLSRHIAGEKGPNASQVVSAAMGVLQGLFRHADALQVQETMTIFFTFMDGRSGSQTPQQWSQEEWACLLAKTLTKWTALQYRFVVLTSLVEHLVEICEGQSTTKQATLLAMVAEILKSKDLTLIGLSTADTLNNLAGLAVRRVHEDIKDPLLPQIVEGIESLANHIYYADQLNDMAEEIVARIVSLCQGEPDVGEVTKTSQSLPRASTRGKKISGEEEKVESIRILVFALTRVIVVANTQEGGDGDKIHTAVEDKNASPEEKGKSSGPALGISISGTRSKIQPETLQPLTALLASYDSPVRLATTQLLLAYFEHEAIEPSAASSEAAMLVHGISAAAHVTAISKSLRSPAGPTSGVENPLHTLVLTERANDEESISLENETESSVPLDYAGLAKVLISANDKLGGAALLASVPALLTIDQSAGRKLVPDISEDDSTAIAQKRRATRLFLAQVWNFLGTKWEANGVKKEAEQVLNAVPDDFPSIPSPSEGLTLPADTELFPDSQVSSESSGASSQVFNRSTIISALASSGLVQRTTGLEEEGLKEWFGRDWNVGIAVDDSSNGASPYSSGGFSEPHQGKDGVASAVKPMQFTRVYSSGEGVNGTSSANGAAGTKKTTGPEDFRQALGSRTYQSSSLQQDTSGRISGLKGPRSSMGAAPPQTQSNGRKSFAAGEQGIEEGEEARDLPPLPTSGTNGTLGGMTTSPSSNLPSSAAERRASRRVSRQGGAAGTKSGDIGGLLDSLGIASSSEETSATTNGVGGVTTNGEVVEQKGTFVPPVAA